MIIISSLKNIDLKNLLKSLKFILKKIKLYKKLINFKWKMKTFKITKILAINLV